MPLTPPLSSNLPYPDQSAAGVLEGQSFCNHGIQTADVDQVLLVQLECWLEVLAELAFAYLDSMQAP